MQGAVGKIQGLRGNTRGNGAPEMPSCEGGTADAMSAGPTLLRAHFDQASDRYRLDQRAVAKLHRLELALPYQPIDRCAAKSE